MAHCRSYHIGSGELVNLILKGIFRFNHFFQVGPPVGENLDESGSSASEARLGSDARVNALVCAEPPPRKAAWHWGSLTLSVPAQIGRYRSAEAVRQGACFLYTLHVTSTQRQDARTYILRVENERGATAHAARLILRGLKSR
jgi:hypothetical protein